MRVGELDFDYALNLVYNSYNDDVVTKFCFAYSFHTLVKSAWFLTITLFRQHPHPPVGVLPLQAAAAVMCRDCHAKSNTEYWL